MRFKKARGGLVVSDVDAVEAHVLRQCATDLLTLLAGEDDDDGAPVDPLEALVGLSSAEVEAPTDPALARLLPDPYGGDDPEAARDFRRYTDGDLRAGKRASAGTVLATLPDGGGRMALDRDACDAWLGCLNDLRLVLGTRLEVTEELDALHDADALPEGDPRRHALEVYSWLGWLQESLVSCLTPRR